MYANLVNQHMYMLLAKILVESQNMAGIYTVSRMND